MINSILNANFIGINNTDGGTVCPVFKKNLTFLKPVLKVTLNCTALGVYEAKVNGNRVGDFFMAPGWTSYHKRLQVQSYDITPMISMNDTEITVTVGNGWSVGRLVGEGKYHFWEEQVAILASVDIFYTDGSIDTVITDSSWKVGKSGVLFSEIYDGETFDARIKTTDWQDAIIVSHSKEMLIPQEGEIIKEIEEINPVKLFTAPNGERIIDFGQNLTGFVKFSVCGNSGDVCELSHAEALDKDGNFYTANMRSAKNKITVICNGEKLCYKPHFSFQGFRYIRIDKWAGEVDVNSFAAVVVHSNMKRTGHFECSNPLINQLYNNIIWGQKGNFLDVPTDCPQRDERLGWTGDAEVFVRTASYNFDVERFFKKWLHDLSADQRADGSVPHVIPNVLGDCGASAAWGDAAAICPWQIYLTYGDSRMLAEQFASMKKWICYIMEQGDNPYLWNNGEHFGDWLGLDAVEGSYSGATDQHLIATAYYAYSTSLLIKAGQVLGYNMDEYKALRRNIGEAFRKEYMSGGKLISDTQTAHVLTLYFDLCIHKEPLVKRLVELIEEVGAHLTTGFVGTPYLLHVLSENGEVGLAYKLLLREEYPSWLYSVKQGATTIWEHWDGVKPDGSMWSADMNSFNHYAFGAVADFMYGVICGINTDEQEPAFKKILFKPQIDDSMNYAKASIQTRQGLVSSEWVREDNTVSYTFKVPKGATAKITLGSNLYEVTEGTHNYKLTV